jgi:hypothetical protein
MKTEALIQDLAAQMQPVRPLGHPLARFGRWAALTAAWAAGGVAAIGIRADLAAVSYAPAFLLHVALTVALGAITTLAAFTASVPGRKSGWWTLAPGVVVASWLLLVVLGVLSTGDGHAGAGVKCVCNLLAFSVPPGLLLCLMLRRSAPLDGRAVGALAAVGVAALAHAGTRFVCRNDGALHLLVWHCGFVFLLGGLGLLAGARGVQMRT